MMHGGGYYVLKDIQMDMDSSFFCDIFILVGSIEDAELQFKLNAINEADSVPGLQHEFVVRYD